MRTSHNKQSSRDTTGEGTVACMNDATFEQICSCIRDIAVRGVIFSGEAE